jgi:ABC-type multidrug transport system permease subunit
LGRIAGGVILVAVPLMARDYYHWATLYEGYFHFGLGAYLVVIAYVCIGTSLLVQFAGKPRTEPRTPVNGVCGTSAGLMKWTGLRH